MSELTEFERSLLLAVIAQHSKYARLSDRIASLKVEHRRNTGVGAYIKFSKDSQTVSIDHGSAQLGFNGDIYVPGVPSGLGCVIDVDNGKLNHIELFTFGDETWNGSTDGARIIPEAGDTRTEAITPGDKS